jgi:Ca-activated chloride channel family protein
MHRNHRSTVSILTTLLLLGCALKNPDTEEGTIEKPVDPSPETVGDADATALTPVVEEPIIEVPVDETIQEEVEATIVEAEHEDEEKPSNLAEAFEGLREPVRILGFTDGQKSGVSMAAEGHEPPASFALHGMGSGGYGLGGGGHAGGRVKARSIRHGQGRIPRREVNINTEEYTDHGVNPFTMVSRDAKSTFSIDVDTASYTMARRKLKQGMLPAWEGVRVEEFVNYFDYDYKNPRRGPFAVHMEAMADPFRKGHHILHVGVQAKRFQPKERPPLHLTFLVDVSGSMSSPDKLGLAKESMHTLVSSMEDGDTVAMATYAGRVARILEPTDVVRSSSIHRAIDSLHSGGSTAMSSGIDLAYEMADEAFERGAENRVVILSDGDANVGRSTWDEMLSQIKGYADQGITLSTIGFGQGNYRDTLMEQLSNKGDGNNFYVDSQDESDRIFGEKIGGTMITVARDTKIQVEFNRDAVKAYRLLGYENRDIADKDFRDDRVDAGEVGSGHSVTALYEVILAKNPDDELATVRLRWEKPGADGEATERSFGFASDKLRGSMSTASDSLKLAYGAATFAEVLRQSPHAAEVELSELQEIVDGVATDKESRELSRLIGMAERLGATDEQVAWMDKR